MSPITYKKFEEKLYELGADVQHRVDVVEVYFEEYTVGNVSKQEKFQIKADFGYVEEFENVEMSKILKLMLRLSTTEISDRIPSYKFKLPNCHESHDDRSWLNVHRETNKVAMASDHETILWQTTFTDEEMDSLPIEVRILIGTLEAYEVEY